MATEHEQAQANDFEDRINQLIWYENPLPEKDDSEPTKIWIPFPHNKETVRQAWEIVNSVRTKTDNPK
jgi:hypothetical protein